MGAIVLWLVIIFAVVAYNKKSVTIKNPARPDAAKGQQGGQAAGSVKKEPNPWDAYQPSDERGRQQALKERLARKYNRPVSGSSVGGDILSRAKAAVEEDFGQTWEQEEEARRRREQEEACRQREQGKEARRQRKEAEAGRQREQEEAAYRRKQERGQLQWGQEEAASLAPLAEGLFLDGGLSLSPGMPSAGRQDSFQLDAVWDLMVKGPDMEITFARDFIAEGVEMLNRIQA